jgi:hypothetical protein
MGDYPHNILQGRNSVAAHEIIKTPRRRCHARGSCSSTCAMTNYAAGVATSASTWASESFRLTYLDEVLRSAADR